MSVIEWPSQEKVSALIWLIIHECTSSVYVIGYIRRITYRKNAKSSKATRRHNFNGAWSHIAFLRNVRRYYLVKANWNSRVWHKRPVQPALQMHSRGFLQNPFLHPGRTWHSSHSSPVHPIRHLHKEQFFESLCLALSTHQDCLFTQRLTCNLPEIRKIHVPYDILLYT